MRERMRALQPAVCFIHTTTAMRLSTRAKSLEAHASAQMQSKCSLCHELRVTVELQLDAHAVTRTAAAAAKANVVALAMMRQQVHGLLHVLRVYHHTQQPLPMMHLLNDA